MRTQYLMEVVSEKSCLWSQKLYCGLECYYKQYGTSPEYESMRLRETYHDFGHWPERGFAPVITLRAALSGLVIPFLSIPIQSEGVCWIRVKRSWRLFRKKIFYLNRFSRPVDIEIAQLKPAAQTLVRLTLSKILEIGWRPVSVLRFTLWSMSWLLLRIVLMDEKGATSRENMP